MKYAIVQSRYGDYMGLLTKMLEQTMITKVVATLI